MSHRAEIVAPERNVSAEIPRGSDDSEFSHRLEMELAGARGASALATAGADAVAKEEWSLCGAGMAPAAHFQSVRRTEEASEWRDVRRTH